MTYSSLYQYAVHTLQSSFEAAQLFAYVTRQPMAQLAFLHDQIVPHPVQEQMAQLCAHRCKGEPLQYLLGEWEFYGLPFLVGEGVLIPRPDTELLVDIALEHIAKCKRPEILDLCSGTGCIAIALQHMRADAAVTAVEMADAAFGYLQQNITHNQSKVQPIQTDLQTYTHPSPISLLTANPPYIPQGELASLQTEVQHEPRSALDGGPDGLYFYHAIAKRYARQLLQQGGVICLEVGIGQAADVCALLKAEGFADLAVHEDFQGIPRVISARKR